MVPRPNRLQPGGVVFHVLYCGNERRELFGDAGDSDAFLRVLAEAQRHHAVSLLVYCLMPNHWHLVVRPEVDGELGRFMPRWTVTHVRRWREHRHVVGLGHLYQGPYRSFPVQDDGHVLIVLPQMKVEPLTPEPPIHAHAESNFLSVIPGANIVELPFELRPDVVAVTETTVRGWEIRPV